MAEQIAVIDNTAKKTFNQELIDALTPLIKKANSSENKSKVAIAPRMQACLDILNQEQKTLTDEEVRNKERIAKAAEAEKVAKEKLDAANKAKPVPAEQPSEVPAEKAPENLNAGHNKSTDNVKESNDDAEHTGK